MLRAEGNLQGFSERQLWQDTATECQWDDLPDDLDVMEQEDLPDWLDEMEQDQDLLEEDWYLEDFPEQTDDMKDEIHQQKEIIEQVKSGEIVLENDLQKGNYGEMVCDQILQQDGYERISADRVTDLNDTTHRGIDGVYYKQDGNPPFRIVDAKYNTAQLDMTADGKQMSVSWIDKRLDAAVGKEWADDIRMAMLDGEVGCEVIRVGKGNDVNAPVQREILNDAGAVIERREC